MGMGIVSDAEFNAELNRMGQRPSTDSRGVGNAPPTDKDSASESIASIIGESTAHRGRKEGDNNVPNGLRKLIADEAITQGRESAVDFAKEFGISPSSVSAYTHGSTSTSSYDKQPNIDAVRQAKLKVGRVARKKLMSALSQITDEKLEGTRVKDLAGIARDMSAIVKNMDDSPTTNQTVQSGPNFIFYTPQFRKEESYEVVESKE